MTTNKIRRIEITIETRERTIIRFGGRRLSVYCEYCQTTVTAFTLDQIAVFFDMTLTDLCRLIGADKFHLVNARRGLPLVCGNSSVNENESAMSKALPNRL